MGVNISLEKVSACDIKYIQQHSPNEYLIISTIQGNPTTIPFIKGTVNPYVEEHKINNILSNKNNETKIIIYGRNSQDMSVIQKYRQLLQLGLTNVYIYIGGLFEWLLLNKQYPTIFLIDNSQQVNLWDFCGEPNKSILGTT